MGALEPDNLIQVNEADEEAEVEEEVVNDNDGNQEVMQEAL